MHGERIDYGIERQRHEDFVGREALLARLDRPQLKIRPGVDARQLVLAADPP